MCLVYKANTCVSACLGSPVSRLFHLGQVHVIYVWDEKTGRFVVKIF